MYPFPVEVLDFMLLLPRTFLYLALGPDAQLLGHSVC